LAHTEHRGSELAQNVAEVLREAHMSDVLPDGKRVLRDLLGDSPHQVGRRDPIVSPAHRWTGIVMSSKRKPQGATWATNCGAIASEP
jgi:hypothetical protein